MVNTDLALRYSLNTAVPTNTSAAAAQLCGPVSAGGAYGCINPLNQAAPSTAQLALQYSNNNNLFLRNFATAFAKMAAAGYGSTVSAVDGATTTGKLGTLTTIDLTTCPV